VNYQLTGEKNNTHPILEKSLANSHPFSKGKNGFQISPLVQEKRVYLGQLDCYETCCEVLEKLASVKVGSTQIYRLTDLHGKGVEYKVNAERTLTP
jgi:hypothetical protein